MGHYDEGEAFTVSQSSENIQNAFLSSGIKGGGGFVANENTRLVSQGTSNGNSLRLPARQRPGACGQNSLVQSHQFYQRNDFPISPGIPPIGVSPRYSSIQLHIDRQGRIKTCGRILGDHLHRKQAFYLSIFAREGQFFEVFANAQFDFPGVGNARAHKRRDNRAFPCARGAKNSEPFACALINSWV